MGRCRGALPPPPPHLPRDSLGNLPVVPPGSPVYDGCYAGSPVERSGGGEPSIHHGRGWDGCGARAPSPSNRPPPDSRNLENLSAGGDRFSGGRFQEAGGRGGRARPPPPSTSSHLGSIADKFLFSSHCMSELVGDCKEPRRNGEEARALPTPPNQQLFPFIRVQRGAGYLHVIQKAVEDATFPPPHRLHPNKAF